MPATSPLTYAEVDAKPPMALMEASHVYVQTWRGYYTSGSTFRWPIQGGGQAGQFFPAGDWWRAGDGVSGQVKASPGTAPVVSVAPPVRGQPPDWVRDFDAPAWNRFSWDACQVFCTPRLVSMSSESCRGHVAAYIYYCIVHYRVV
jgi:hypothetical protein